MLHIIETRKPIKWLLKIKIITGVLTRIIHVLFTPILPFIDLKLYIRITCPKKKRKEKYQQFSDEIFNF